MAGKTGKPKQAGGYARRCRGFERTSSLVAERIRRTGESRGFGVARLLTRWAEIVGPDIAAIARPAEVRYGRKQFGATLTLLTTGARAPMLEMQKERIREKVNAAYGYAAISRIRLAQTAAAGFAEESEGFEPAPSAPAPETRERAAALSGGVGDERLRAALESLGANVFTRQQR